MKHCFVVTSAVNSRFGVFKPQERLQQTLATLDTIRTRAPGSKIILMECAGTPLTPEQDAVLDAAADLFLDFTLDDDVQAIYRSDNWDVVKNTTEIMCFARTLQMCWDDGDFDDCDRIHKMSGRYLLNNEFSLDLYKRNPDRIIIGPKHTSQFPLDFTGIKYQYMARLWSWPKDFTPSVIDVYNNSLAYISDRIARGGYADIEHVLYRFLPPPMVTEVPFLGVEGIIAPNGAAVKN